MSPEYLAGFFDGEGTFYIGKQVKKSTGKSYPSFKVMLSQSGEDGLALLEEIQRFIGGELYKHLNAGQYKATKPAYKLYWNKEEALRLINFILPFLILKRQAAIDVLNYINRKESLGRE
jgi:hypothetical protein